MKPSGMTFVLVLVAALALTACAAGEAGGGAPGPGADAAGAGPDAAEQAVDGAGALPDGGAAAADAAPDAGPVDGAAADAAAGPDAAPDVPPDVPPVTDPFEVPVPEEDGTFAVGPFVSHAAPTAVNVVFESAEPGAPRVEYGPDAAYGATASAAPGAPHVVVVDGLAPGTVYHYRACVDALCTGDLLFATAPQPGRPFRFAVYGDSRSDPVQHRAVVDTILESRPALVLNTGDIVAQGNERAQYKEMHFDPTRRLGHSVPIYVSIGNHEWKDVATRVQNFRDYLAYPEEDGVPLKEASYSVRYGDAFFLVLDNTLDGLDLFFPVGAGDGPPLWRWLRERVTSEDARTARWRFASFHYPPASPCHEDWMNIVATREHVIPLLREHGFHAVFSGHVHGYERHDFDGLPVFVTGGGGAGLQDEGECTRDAPTLRHLLVAHHHLAVDITPDSATVRAIDLDGGVVDELPLAP